MNLYDATTELHHTAEQHSFGSRMALGELSADEWAGWLHSLLVVHVALDAHLPGCVSRAETLADDYLASGGVVPPAPAARQYASELATASEETVLGAAYIFCGAHLRGGAVIRKRLEPKGIQCDHLRFGDQAREADQFLKSLRERPELAEAAREAFRRVIGIMGDLDAAPGRV